MTNFEIVSIVTSYRALKEKGEAMKLPATVAWKRRVNLSKLAAAKTMIDEAIAEIQNEYSDDAHSEETTTGTGEIVRSVRKEYLPEYSKKIAEIYSQETDVEIKKVKIEDLGDITLTDAEMDTIAFMIEEENDG